MNLRFGRKAALILGGIAGALLLGWLVVSQGPFAPVKATIATVEVLGAFRAPAAVKAALAPRTN